MPLLSIFSQPSGWKMVEYLCRKQNWNETPGYRMCGKSWTGTGRYKVGREPVPAPPAEPHVQRETKA